MSAEKLREVKRLCVQLKAKSTRDYGDACRENPGRDCTQLFIKAEGVHHACNAILALLKDTPAYPPRGRDHKRGERRRVQT